ncbi:MAG: right-handed parallel beta-helix repeat-containing protein [Bacteroidia bacterium]|nr:right-handed parallel beta-helix repeat-containing protein [Bacteroidia bacterium]
MKTKSWTTVAGVVVLFFALTWYSCSKNEEHGGDSVGMTWIICTGTNIDTTTYYVSTNGNDANNGLSQTTAFGSLARAFTVIRPGGTIRILPGTYNTGIGLQLCGDSAAPITVEGYQGVPVLDGQNRIAIGIFCEGCKNMIFRNLKIQYYTDIGIGLENGNTFVFRNLEVLENGHAVQLTGWKIEGYGIHVDYSENIEIRNNTVYRNGPEPQLFPDYLMGTGINTYGNTNVVIADNKSYRNIGGGILVEDSWDVIVERNEIYENDLDATADGWWDGGIWLDGGGNVTLRENNIYDNLGPGLEISNEDNQWIRGYLLENNISTNNYYGIYIWNFGTTTWPDTAIIKNINNNFTGNSVQDVWIQP